MSSAPHHVDMLLVAAACALAALGLPLLLLRMGETGRALGFRARLRQKGYGELPIRAAELLDRRGDPLLLRRLPPRDELAVLPGFEETEGLFLLEASRMLSRRRRRSLERRGEESEFVTIDWVARRSHAAAPPPKSP
jgi:hypothetical protein